VEALSLGSMLTKHKLLVCLGLVMFRLLLSVAVIPVRLSKHRLVKIVPILVLANLTRNSVFAGGGGGGSTSDSPAESPNSSGK